MLVLSRKIGETIVIGDQIKVKVLSVEGETVRLGIHAPKQIEIFREEIYASIQQSNQSSSLKGVNTTSVLAQLFDQIRKSEEK